MELLILGLVFLAVVLAGTGIWLLVGEKSATSRRLQQRLRGVQQVAEYNLGDSLAAREEAKRRQVRKRREAIKSRAFRSVPVLEERASKRPWLERLNGQLQRAQVPLTALSFLLLCAGAGLVGAALTVLWARRLNPVLALMGLGVFAAAPYLFVKFGAASRERKFSLQFPDALDLLSSCVKSGQSLGTAIQNVADEMPDPVAEEFRIMAEELSFGEDLSKVLKRFSQRMSTEDVQVFCTALQIQRDSGGNLSEVLDGLQKTIRERFRILRQVKTLTAQGRLSGWIVGILPIALGGIIYMFDPEYISDLFTPTGRKLLFVAVALQVVGILMIRKIVNIKV